MARNVLAGIIAIVAIGCGRGAPPAAQQTAVQVPVKPQPIEPQPEAATRSAPSSGPSNPVSEEGDLERAGDQLTQEEPPVDPEARSAYEKHCEDSTLFDVSTFQEFDRNGWKRDFALLLRDRGKASCLEGICLILEPLPNHAYEVGKPFDCIARLSNSRVKPRLLDIGGTCGMTDALTLMVFSTIDGQIFSCRGRVGGSHCFCKAKRDFVSQREPHQIETGFASDAAVAWVPAASGDYVVVGAYALKTLKGSTETIYSQRLVVKVKEATQ